MNKETSTLKTIAAILCLSILVSGCVSSTVLSTTPSDADVYVQNQRVGKTPYTYSDRKIAGSSTLISFKKEGYEDYVTTIRKDKKLNVGALLSGILVYPLLWILGYGESYNFSLEEAQILPEPVAVSLHAKEEVTAPAAPANVITDSMKLPTSSKVEKLLSQDQVDKAVKYAEDQEGTFQAGCYYAIALYYLDKNDYSNAESFFSKSGKINEGYVRIAEALMQGVKTDSALVINEKAPPVISEIKDIPALNYEVKLISEDDRVLISIDSIVRTSTQPQDLVAALKAGNSSLSARPAKNADYVLVYFNKTLKKELNLTSGEQELAKISLTDQSGKNYTIILERGHNYIKNPGGGQIWFNPDLPLYQGISKLEGYEGVIIDYSYMMFFMPANTTPARLNYVYNFKNDKQDRKPGTSILTMNLLQ